jgi:hypothetical protein
MKNKKQNWNRAKWRIVDIPKSLPHLTIPKKEDTGDAKLISWKKWFRSSPPCSRCKSRFLAHKEALSSAILPAPWSINPHPEMLGKSTLWNTKEIHAPRAQVPKGTHPLVLLCSTPGSLWPCTSRHWVPTDQWVPKALLPHGHQATCYSADPRLHTWHQKACFPTVHTLAHLWKSPFPL